MAKGELAPRGGEIVIYQTEGGQTKIEVQLEDETVWLAQAGLAEVFQTTKQNISLHIKNIYEEGELYEDSVVKEYFTTAADGKCYKTKHYNRNWREKLDAFLQFNERDILKNAGKVTKEVADKLALEQYDTFHKHRLAQEAEQEARADDKEYEKHFIEQAGQGENDFDQAAKKIEAKRKRVKEKEDDG